MENSKIYLHAGAQFVSLATYFYLASEVQGYCSFNLIVGATALQYMRSNQVNDQEKDLYSHFNWPFKAPVWMNQFNTWQKTQFNLAEPQIDLKELPIFAPSLGMIALGGLMSRVGFKVWVMTMVYFGTTYQIIHNQRPKRVDIPEDLLPLNKSKSKTQKTKPKTPQKARTQIVKRTQELQTKSIVDFFLGKEGSGTFRHSLHAIVFEYNENQIESYHDFIQWLFPTTSKSQFNAQAPLVTQEVITAFQEEGENGEKLRLNLRLGFVRMLRHYGLQLDQNRVCKNLGTFDAQASKYLRPGDHNLRRISRILSSLNTLSQNELAQSFSEFLDGYTRDENTALRDTYEEYWKGICRLTV